MSGFGRFEIYDELSSSPLFIRETSIFKPKCLTFPSFTQEIELGFALDLLTPNPFDFTPSCLIPQTPFDTIADLIQIKKTQKLDTNLKLKSLCDRVSALELGFEKMVMAKKCKKDEDRKYSWIAEINSTEKDGINKKYEWTTEIKGGKKEEKSYKYVAEFKGKGKDSALDRKYIFKASTSPAAKKDEGLIKKKKKDEKALGIKRIVEIEEEPVKDQGAVILKQAFAKRIRAGNNGKGKKKELSPQDAAKMIQMNFRAYLIRRSQVLRALRELAVAKARLKEIRALFNNFSYRHRIARDAEERQKFSEKIIVLLLTVDRIEVSR
ncbi:Bag family molecular chaperone regulator [Thalictrum thalictroides]|uniref:Bag family molecular chaperone regulator n=1 Tax=Thalictrum thalictroides TaxID=46969 RepID=A0A7J6XFS8_THATH|nr:Bag family molecular chaperone regulator [Thalictrum thalictroides]